MSFMFSRLPRTLAPTILSKVNIKHIVKLILYFPVVADGAENTLAVLYRADVIGHLCSLFSLALVVTFARDPMNTLDPGPIFKGVGIIEHFWAQDYAFHLPMFNAPVLQTFLFVHRVTFSYDKITADETQTSLQFSTDSRHNFKCYLDLVNTL